MLPVIIMTGTLSMASIATGHQQWQIETPWGPWHPWFIVWAPAAFIIFLIAALAEANRAPFDHAEAEQELVGGFHTEYGGLRYAAFANAEYLHLLAISAIGVTFFLGGPTVPGIPDAGPWLEVLSFILKMTAFLFLFIWIRATVPRLRYDRLMRFGWKVLLPVATVQMLFTATLVTQDWGQRTKGEQVAAKRAPVATQVVAAKAEGD
jgi:NADH-quinone oxidoreductase subunit H